MLYTPKMTFIIIFSNIITIICQKEENTNFLGRFLKKYNLIINDLYFMYTKNAV